MKSPIFKACYLLGETVDLDWLTSATRHFRKVSKVIHPREDGELFIAIYSDPKKLSGIPPADLDQFETSLMARNGRVVHVEWGVQCIGFTERIAAHA